MITNETCTILFQWVFSPFLLQLLVDEPFDFGSPKTMEAKEINSPLGYGKAPWMFKGSALYQLHLVKSETARAFIPKDFRLVEAFGYTLGGFFLANYEDSPAGIFDELVVIAGIVWNPPTSCAWAARVLVNSDEACIHGRKDVGLPSQVAKFSKKITALPKTTESRFGGFLNMIGMADSPDTTSSCMNIRVSEGNGEAAKDICSINLVPQPDSNKWIGPVIKISLPSFSGRTEYNPHLLKYSCQIECRVRAVPAAKISRPFVSDVDGRNSSEGESSEIDTGEDKRNLSLSVMLSKPILALEFSCLKMKVDDPTIVPESPPSETSILSL
ncbi:Hypothetical predicted protein [Olea europaea subsp. europaea]|uniref:Protein NEOXANTHIN-DEFICIENT 1 n=1 Tax=Olea europaea subsp. europaea TaxID=158383 RepID=A0A8S0PMX1_OLEEU|nr:Hypothetical predicted protein [Olea europaea subsp. europaea]